MIQEEKESTELRAEELETRVTSGSMEGLNLTQLCKRASIPTSLTALSLASSSPPLSGRSTPKLSSRSAAQDLDRMGIMTLVRRWQRWGGWTGGVWVPGVGVMPRHLQGGDVERGCPCLPALRGGSPLTAPLSVSLSLSPLQSAQRLEEAPEETASEWLPSRWVLSNPPFSSLLLALSTPGQGAAGAGWSWGIL